MTETKSRIYEWQITFEGKVFEYLKKLGYNPRVDKNIGPFRPDIVVSDQNDKIREIYEVILNDDQTSIQKAEVALSRYAAYLGKDADVKYFIAYPGENGNVEIREVDKSDLKGNPAYNEEKKEKTVDELRYVSFFLSAMTATVLISLTEGWVKFTAIEFSLYLICIGLILLPYAQEINIFNFFKFKRPARKPKSNY